MLFAAECHSEELFRFHPSLGEIAFRKTGVCKTPLQRHPQLPVFHQRLSLHIVPDGPKMFKSTLRGIPARVRTTCHYAAESTHTFPGGHSQDRFANLPGAVKVHSVEMNIGAADTQHMRKVRVAILGSRRSLCVCFP